MSANRAVVRDAVMSTAGQFFPALPMRAPHAKRKHSDDHRAAGGLRVHRRALTGCGENSAERLAKRNGRRDWGTRAGTVELHIPRPRKGAGFPGFIEPRRLRIPSQTCYPISRRI